MKTPYPCSILGILRTLFPAGVFKKYVSALFLAGGLSVLASQSALAQSTVWSNGAGTFIWDTTSDNWGANTTWASGTAATFSSSVDGVAGNVTVDSGGITAGALTITAAGYDFSGGALSVASGNVTVNTEFDDSFTDSGGLTVSGATVTFTGGGAFTNSSAATFSSTTASGTLDFTSGAYTFSSQALFGEATSTSISTSVFFSGSSTFTVNSTTVIGYAQQASVFYDSTGTSAFDSGLDIGRGGNSSLTQQAGTINMAGHGVTDGYGDYNSTVDIQGGTFNVGTLGFNLGYTGAGTTAVSNLLTVEDTGTLISSTIALVANTTTVTNADATLTLSGSGTIETNAITETASATPNAYLINLTGGTLEPYSTAGLTSSVAITLGGNTTLNAETAALASANIALSGVLSGTGGFNVAGLGTVTISGNANTFTGNVNVSSGTLNVSGNLGAASVVNVTGGKLTLSSETALASTTSLVFASSLSPSSVSLSFTGTDTIAALSLDGGSSFVAIGIYDDSQLNALYGSSLFTGAGDLDVTANAIPEPSTYASLAGLLTLGFSVWMRRRRKSAKIES